MHIKQHSIAPLNILTEIKFFLKIQNIDIDVFKVMQMA